MRRTIYLGMVIILALVACSKEEVDGLSPQHYPESVVETIEHQGNTRNYTLYIPESFDGTNAFP